MESELGKILLSLFSGNFLELFVGIVGTIAGALPLIAKKLAMKKNATLIANIIIKYRKIKADNIITQEEYAELGSEVLPILEDFERKFAGLSWWKSKCKDTK